MSALALVYALAAGCLLIAVSLTIRRLLDSDRVALMSGGRRAKCWFKKRTARGLPISWHCECGKFNDPAQELCPNCHAMHPYFTVGSLDYLRETYAVGFITIDELEEGVHSVLTTGSVNVPREAPLPERERPFRSAP